MKSTLRGANRLNRNCGLAHHRHMALVLLLGGAVFIGILMVCFGPRGYEALLVLTDLNAGAGLSHFKARTAAPTHQSMSYSAGGRRYAADLYLPAEGRAQAGVVLVPGVVENAPEDPRLVAFATTLARARFAVLVPSLPGFRALQVHPSDASEVSAAFSLLVSRSDLAPQGRAGIIALSYAVGISALAAMDERIRDQVRFILGVGGYYDMTEAIIFLTTGYFKQDERWQHLEPDPYAARVFLESGKDSLGDPADRVVLESIEELRSRNPAADTSSLAAGLGPEGRALYDLLQNTDPLRTPALIARLPQALQSTLSQLSLSNKDLAPLKARLILLADRADNMIPYSQSVELAHAVREGQAQVYLVGSLAHVEMKRWHYLSWKFFVTGVPDFCRMYVAVYALLKERG